VRPAEIAAPAAASGLVLVVDDDPLVLRAMDGLLASWGYGVIARGSHDDVVAEIAAAADRPDLIVADFHLSGGRTGIETIEHVRAAFGADIPAFLISGDTSPERLQQSRERGYILLHKPVSPMALRALLASLCGGQPASPGERADDHLTT
jgi:CheY-like chemotaxis protein